MGCRLCPICGECVKCNPCNCTEEAGETISTLRTQLKEAVEGLKKYAWHLPEGCPRYWDVGDRRGDDGPCTCGFDALLKRLDG